MSGLQPSSNGDETVQLKTQKPPEEDVEIADVFAVRDPVQTAEAQLPTEWWLSPLS